MMVWVWVLGEAVRGEVGVLSTGQRRSCYSDTGMLAMPLSKVISKIVFNNVTKFLKHPFSINFSKIYWALAIKL